MTKDEEQAIVEHDITRKSKDVYHYKDFRYDRLADAIRYAKIDAERPRLENGNS